MGVRTGLAIMAALGALWTPARAQIPLTPARPSPTDPDAVIVDELVVTARLPGPAWWTVTKGQSTVYVLGTPSIAPKHMAWDRGLFERRLQGASEVILPMPDMRVSVTGAFSVAFNYFRLKSFTPFEETLDPATRARFVAARERLGQPADHYKTKNPLVAGVTMAGDSLNRYQLTPTDPMKLIRLLAQQAKVPTRQQRYDVGPLLSAVVRISPEAGRECLSAVMTQVESGPAPALAAAKAWADGDVRGALGNDRTFERCVALVPGAQTFDAKAKRDQVAEIEAALARPGHAIAVIQLQPLLSQGGVLDQLRAKGFEVKTPGEE